MRHSRWSLQRLRRLSVMVQRRLNILNLRQQIATSTTITSQMQTSQN
jgi:hypothetical protein